VRLWNPATGQQIGAPLHASAHNLVMGVAFSPSGRLLASAGLDGSVRLWNPATGQPVGAPLETRAQHGATSVAFSPDGKLLASGGIDGTVRLWNAATGQPIGATLHASAHGVPSVAFSRDGTLLAASDVVAGTVQVLQVSLLTHAYSALCAYVGPPTSQEWHQYAFGERQPKACG